MFCQKIGVPFDLYAFTSHNKDDQGGWNPTPSYMDEGNTSKPRTPKDYWDNGNESLEPFQMLNFLSSSRGRKQTIEDMRNLFYTAEAMRGRWDDTLDWGGGVPQ